MPDGPAPSETSPSEPRWTPTYPAPLWRRIAAFVVDALLLGVLVGVIVDGPVRALDQATEQLAADATTLRVRLAGGVVVNVEELLHGTDPIPAHAPRRDEILAFRRLAAKDDVSPRELEQEALRMRNRLGQQPSAEEIEQALSTWSGVPEHMPFREEILAYQDHWVEVNAQELQVRITVLGLWLLLFFIYSVVMLAWTGRTLGKRVLSLRVVRVGGKPLGWRRCAARTMLYPLSVLPLGLGLIWSMTNTKHQAWHDLLVQSRVIQK